MQFIENLRLTPNMPFASRVHGFWRSFVLALGLALASMMGVFEPLDGILYDAFVRHSPGSSVVMRKVVLVESPAAEPSAPSVRWDSVAAGLIARGASQVVFTGAPPGSREVVESLLKNPKVIVSGGLRDNTADASKAIFSVPRGARDLSLQAASVVADPLMGVHRGQHYMYRIGDRDLPTLEALTASRLGIGVPGEGHYLIDFSGDASGFPRVTLNQLLNREVSEGVLQGRTVLIDPAGGNIHRMVVTPITKSGREVSELEYHAYALDTLLRGTAVSSFSPLTMGAAVIGIWLLCLTIMQPMQFRQAVVAASLMTTGLALLSWGLLPAGYHLPVIGPILVIAASLVSVFLSKTESQNQALERLATEANLAVSARLTGQGVSFDDAFWSNVLAMIDQLLPVTRVVLLERAEGSRHVSEVRSLRCSAGAVEERRRDFSRAPYSTAIEKGKAVETGNYLIDAGPGEHQFLAPLVWGGQVLGFWAFGIPRLQMVNSAMLMHAADLLGKKLSELMFARRQGVAYPAIAAGWRDRLADQRDVSILNLSQHLSMIESHIHVLEDVFNGMEVPTMVSDLFGRPLLSNASMKALPLPEKNRSETDSIAGLLETFCQLAPEEVRTALAGVVFNGERFETFGCIGKTRHRLRVSRLYSGARPMTGNEVLQHIHGLMVQVFPVTRMETIEDTQRESRPLIAPPKHEATVVAGGAEVEEVDLLDVMDEAIASIASSPEHEALSFAVNGSRSDVKVLAQRSKLKDILTTLVRFLAEDSRQRGEITVNLDTQKDDLIIDMQNKGFGMPDDKLQAMLEGADVPRSDYLRRLRQLRESAIGNQGRLDLRSTVGGGYVAKLTMRLAG